MRFTSLRVQGYRNFPFLEMDLSGDAHFIIGKNGQGKTNLLEALNLITAARSFRVNQHKFLLAWEKEYPDARLFYQVEDRDGETEIEIQLSPKSKKILIGDEPVRVMRDFLGYFPTVTLSSDDIQLLRGSPQNRRRFFDMAIASVDAEYFNDLRFYHKGLRERNMLLKQGGAKALIHAFDKSMASPAYRLISKRREFFNWLNPVFENHYISIGGDENPAIELSLNLAIESEFEVLEAWEKSYARDQKFGTTHRGPHRDDFSFGLKGHEAKDFASEGQQRGLVLALRLAQINWFEIRTNRKPVILADDILGELDVQRREGFWRTIDDSYQLLATGTQLPEKADARAWSFWEMEEGKVKKVKP